MPRKLRIAKTRTDVVVSRALQHLLIWGDFSAACTIADEDGDDPFDLFAGVDEHERAWAAIVEDAVIDWTTVYPGSRPIAWWQWTAPELRQVIGGTYRSILGVGRCHQSGIPYIAVDRDDPPLIESTPAFLDRLGLWRPGERARVSPDAFTPQTFSFDLTASIGAARS